MTMLFSRVFGAAVLTAVMVIGTMILATPITSADLADTHHTAGTEGAMSWNGNLIQTACAVSVAKSLSQSALGANDQAIQFDKVVETCGAGQIVEALKAIRLPMATSPVRFELVAADTALTD